MLPAADTIRRAKYDINAQRPPLGLVIGRFIPPHGGHDHLIDEAYDRSGGRLRVMVMARPDEKIPGYLRAQWLRKEHPQIGKTIQLVTQTLPEDYGSEEVWQMWIRLIQKRMHGLRVSKVFSSETYGDRLAKDLGVTHELVDLAREAVNISATKIRKDFEAHKIPDVQGCLQMDESKLGLQRPVAAQAARPGMTAKKLSRSKEIALKNMAPGPQNPKSVEAVDDLDRTVTSMEERVAQGAMIRVWEVSQLLTKAELAGLVNRQCMMMLPPEQSRFVRLEVIPDSFPKDLGMIPAYSQPVISHVREAVQAFRAAAAGQPFTSRREVYAAAYAYAAAKPEKLDLSRFQPLI